MDVKEGPTVTKYEYGSDDEIHRVQTTAALGTTVISDSTDIFLVPMPSADPRDPLNMKTWHKYVFVLLVSIFSSLGLSLVSGFGGLLGFYIPVYVERESNRLKWMEVIWLTTGDRRSKVCRHFCFDDISYYVHGHRQPSLRTFLTYSLAALSD